MTETLLRGRLLTFHREPADQTDTEAYTYLEDAGLLVGERREARERVRPVGAALGSRSARSPHGVAERPAGDHAFGRPRLSRARNAAAVGAAVTTSAAVSAAFRATATPYRTALSSSRT